MSMFELWKIKGRGCPLSKDIEGKAISFAEKYVCGNCRMRCKQIDLLCGCVRYYINAFMDGYKSCREDDRR